MFENIAQAITGFLKHNNNPLGLLLLGLSALLEYVFPPFPGDTVTLFGAFLITRYNWNMPLVFCVVLFGSSIGAMIDFYFGVWMGKRYREGKFIRNEKVRAQIEKVLKTFERHGEAYIALNRFLPAVRAVFFVAAGMAKLRASHVLFFALLSAAAWNALIIGAGYAVGTHWSRIQDLFRTYSIAAWAILGTIALALFARWLIRKQRSKSS